MIGTGACFELALVASSMTIAYYCVLAAGLLPILSAGLTKVGNFGPNDNNAARVHAEAQTGWRKRAFWRNTLSGRRVRNSEPRKPVEHQRPNARRAARIRIP